MSALRLSLAYCAGVVTASAVMVVWFVRAYEREHRDRW